MTFQHSELSCPCTSHPPRLRNIKEVGAERKTVRDTRWEGHLWRAGFWIWGGYSSHQHRTHHAPLPLRSSYRQWWFLGVRCHSSVLEPLVICPSSRLKQINPHPQSILIKYSCLQTKMKIKRTSWDGKGFAEKGDVIKKIRRGVWSILTCTKQERIS